MFALKSSQHYRFFDDFRGNKLNNLLKFLIYFKGSVCYVFASLFFFNLKESTLETRANNFISLQKLFLFLIKSKFRILDVQISWRHEMPKHKKRNTFYWTSLWVKHILLMKFSQFIWYYKRKYLITKFYKTCNLKTSSRPFCVCKELSTSSIGKWDFWSKLLILDM